jgi:hypothetical protein
VPAKVCGDANSAAISQKKIRDFGTISRGESADEPCHGTMKTVCRNFLQLNGISHPC